MSLFGFGKKQKSDTTETKNVSHGMNENNVKTRWCLEVTDEVPVIWDNGKVYYADDEYLIGTYEVQDSEVSQEEKKYKVYDRYGKCIGTVEWDCYPHRTTGQYFSYYDKEERYLSLDSSKLGREPAFFKTLRDLSFHEKRKIYYEVFANCNGICRDDDVICSYCPIDANYRLLETYKYPPEREEYPQIYVGMMAAFICWNEVDFTAPYHVDLIYNK